MTAPLHVWSFEPLAPEVARAAERLRRTEGVAHVALMPDAHLAHDVCIGSVVASEDRLFPDAVGGDAGCGMRAVRVGYDAERLRDSEEAARVLGGLIERVPIQVRDAPAPEAPAPEAIADLARKGRWQLGTLGRGNHFLELQRDDADATWLMIHTGSRSVGPAIRDRFRARAQTTSTGLSYLGADEDDGGAYLEAIAYARAWARRSRALIEDAVTDLLEATVDEESRIDIDHNHVSREVHGGRPLWVHRKGAARADPGTRLVIPGSMGTASYHVEGRGAPDALCSSPHGAGRTMSRADARRRMTDRRLHEEMRGVYFDHRKTRALREEAPSAYKAIGAVMRAARPLVRVIRRLEPLLVHKGG